MRIFLTASKDTTLYQRFPTTNAGLDEILEVGKVAAPEDLGIAYTGSSARTVINFKLPTTASVAATASYFLNLKIANATKLPYEQELKVYKVSGSWMEGSGYSIQKNNVRIPLYSGSTYLGDFDPAKIVATNDGATWRQATTSTSWSNEGGTYYTSPTQSVILNEYPLQDLRIDVTNLVQPVVTASLDWHGLAIVFPTASDDDKNNQGNIKFFSRQTHTVHQPTLEVVWDDSVFVTGSLLKAIPNTLDISVVPKNAKDVYTRGTKEKLRFIVRDKYPPKAFDATLRYKTKYYLPSSSYYSITDTQAGTTIYPDDVYAKLSCDPTSSYFVLDTTPLYKNRYYTVNLTINNGTSDTLIISDVFTFLVK